MNELTPLANWWRVCMLSFPTRPSGSFIIELMNCLGSHTLVLTYEPTWACCWARVKIGINRNTWAPSKPSSVRHYGTVNYIWSLLIFPMRRWTFVVRSQQCVRFSAWVDTIGAWIDFDDAPKWSHKNALFNCEVATEITASILCYTVKKVYRNNHGFPFFYYNYCCKSTKNI